MTVNVRLEFTVEPFVDGGPGRHVVAALSTLEAAGFEPEVGPFGTAIEGDDGAVLAAGASALRAAFAAGATAVALDVREQPLAPEAIDLGEEAAEFLQAVAPLVRALGGTVVAGDRLADGDVRVTWRGATLAGVRPGGAGDDLQDALPRLIASVEQELGGSLAALSRDDKQQAARLLEEGGAFTLRNATEAVADAMGVSRVTVYNYLAAIRRQS